MSIVFGRGISGRSSWTECSRSVGSGSGLSRSGRVGSRGRGMMANQVGNRCHGRGLGCRGKVIPSPGRQAEGWGSWVAEEDSCHPPAPLVAVNNPAPELVISNNETRRIFFSFRALWIQAHYYRRRIQLAQVVQCAIDNIVTPILFWQPVAKYYSDVEAGF